jgi:hypothetical protein
VIASESNPEPPTGFACGEVRGGNGTIHAKVALPGLRGVLYSRPCAGATGGDIHQPRSTRHREHLIDWDVTHYEIVQSASGAATAKGPRGAAAR